MPLSRLRLRLAAWFGAAFVLGLLVLDVGFLSYSKRKAEDKLTRELTSAALELRESIQLERTSRPELPVDSSVHEVLLEWPDALDVIAIFDSSGRRIDARGPSALLSGVTSAALREDPIGTGGRVVILRSGVVNEVKLELPGEAGDISRGGI